MSAMQWKTLVLAGTMGLNGIAAAQVAPEPVPTPPQPPESPYVVESRPVPAPPQPEQPYAVEVQPLPPSPAPDIEYGVETLPPTPAPPGVQYRSMPRVAVVTEKRARVDYQAGVYYDQLKQRQGWIGVAVSKASPVLAYQLRLPHGAGIVVENVLPKSPADEAGVQQYDIIEKLDDQLLVNPEQFQALVNSHHPGAQVSLTIVREGKRHHVEVKLSKPNSGAAIRFFKSTKDETPWIQNKFEFGGNPGYEFRQWKSPKFDFKPYPTPKMPPGGYGKGDANAGRIEQVEPGNITILRDKNGGRIIIVRDPNGKVIVKQRIGDDGPAAKPSPDKLRDLDDLKQKLRDDADDDQDKPITKEGADRPKNEDNDSDDKAQFQAK